MCLPGCTEHVMRTLSRRGLFTAAASAAAATALAPTTASARPFPAFSKVTDLTHTHSPEFPTFFGVPGVSLKRIKDFKKDGFNMMEWTVIEHTGTHFDAPIHFSEQGVGPEAIAVDQLVVPLAVIDVSAKAATDADYQLTPQDIKAWEKRHGALPRGCCVAMQSGWDRHVSSDKFTGADSKGGFHFPGFHPETADLLLKERSVAGIASDTLSLDHGQSKDFRTHTTWLPSGRWGLENVANLAQLPARGATIIVGAPKIKGATGGPSRVLALT
jgi:kynurenine formamidase